PALSRPPPTGTTISGRSWPRRFVRAASRRSRPSKTISFFSGAPRWWMQVPAPGCGTARFIGSGEALWSHSWSLARTERSTRDSSNRCSTSTPEVTGVSDGISLAGKVAVVTGGGRGVGRAIGRALAGAGAHVHVVARTENQLAETVRLIEAASGVAVATAVDLTRAVQVFGVLKPRAEELSGAPQILLNAAGTFGPIALVANGDPDAWQQTIASNTIAPYLTCRAFVSGM